MTPVLAINMRVFYCYFGNKENVVTRYEFNGESVFVHTIDGTAGSGKGTVANHLREQGIPVLDTGQGFRAVTELWYQLQEEDGLEREDSEAVDSRLRPFRDPLSRSHADEHFASLLPDNVYFDVDGVYIGGEKITEKQKSEVLYNERVDRIISTIAQLPLVRSFCRDISLQFIQGAIEAGEPEVGVDGRTGRQEVVRYLQQGDIDTRSARLALPAFFEAAPKEAARRVLARDGLRSYGELSPDDEEVKQRAVIVHRRNKGDSNPNATEPMGCTSKYVIAGRNQPDAETIDCVIGNNLDGSEAQSVHFNTTRRSREEMIKEYESWRLAINERLRQPLGRAALAGYSRERL